MLELEINELKSISEFRIALPLNKGLYAITGENGVGKSTIFAALSKLVYKMALQNFFRKDGGAKTSITFRFAGVENRWEKPLGWVRADTNASEIFFDGFYEGSLIFGSRFSDAHTSRMAKTSNIHPADVCDADEFVRLNLGRILRNDPAHYDGLKRVRSKSVAERIGFSGIPYIIERGGRWIHQYQMSSGEFLLIGLLHFINERIKFKQKKGIADLSLIIMDEIELALHPSAQHRLAIFLNEIASSSNFCIYFATHSVQIIGRIPPEKIYHLERSPSGAMEVINPCYPLYATRCLYGPEGFDFIVLVEDELAKNFVERAIRDGGLYTSKLIKILPAGGWEKTLELQYEFQNSGLAGSSCKVVSILDGDIADECDRRHPKGTQLGGLPKNFLPIKSLEKYLKEKLVSSPDDAFFRTFGDMFFRTRSLADIVREYLLDPRSSKDGNGKGLFTVLRRCASAQGHSEDVFKRDVCDFISRTENSAVLVDALGRLFS